MPVAIFDDVQALFYWLINRKVRCLMNFLKASTFSLVGYIVKIGKDKTQTSFPPCKPVSYSNRLKKVMLFALMMICSSKCSHADTYQRKTWLTYNVYGSSSSNCLLLNDESETFRGRICYFSKYIGYVHTHVKGGWMKEEGRFQREDDWIWMTKASYICPRTNDTIH